jgi:hypothetical protein
VPATKEKKLFSAKDIEDKENKESNVKPTARKRTRRRRVTKEEN